MLTINNYTITSQTSINKILKCFRKSIKHIHFVFNQDLNIQNSNLIYSKRIAITISILEIIKMNDQFKFNFTDAEINTAFKTLYIAAKEGHTVYIPHKELWIGDGTSKLSYRTGSQSQNYTFEEPKYHDSEQEILIEQYL